MHKIKLLLWGRFRYQKTLTKIDDFHLLQDKEGSQTLFIIIFCVLPQGVITSDPWNTSSSNYYTTEFRGSVKQTNALVDIASSPIGNTLMIQDLSTSLVVII